MMEMKISKVSDGISLDSALNKLKELSLMDEHIAISNYIEYIERVKAEEVEWANNILTMYQKGYSALKHIADILKYNNDIKFSQIKDIACNGVEGDSTFGEYITIKKSEYEALSALHEAIVIKSSSDKVSVDVDFNKAEKPLLILRAANW